MCSIWGGFSSLASILDFQHCTDEAQKAETVKCRFSAFWLRSSVALSPILVEDQNSIVGFSAPVFSSFGVFAAFSRFLDDVRYNNSGGEYGSVFFSLRPDVTMALSRPQTFFAHRRTVRLIVDNDMDIDALKIAKSLPDFAENIRGIVPQFGGRCFDITVDSADVAAQLAQSGFDYGDIRKPLKLLGARSIHVSVFVSVEFPDEDLLKLLATYGELKTRHLRRLHFTEEGFTHIENGVRVAEFNKNRPRDS